MDGTVDALESRLLLTTAAAGDQFLVAESASFSSTPPMVAVQSGGAFTSVWESFETDGSGFGVFAQRFDAGGSPLTLGSYQVNTYASGEQSAPAIAGDETGNVLIVWQSKGQDDVDGGFGIYGQWYNNTGATIGSEFLINSTTAGDQEAPSVAMDELGNAIVVWQSNGQDGDDWGVYYKRFESVGDTTGTELRANVATIGRQQAPAVAAGSNGNFVIAWEAVDPAGGSDASLDIYARVFDSASVEIAGEMRVNTAMLRDQVTPQVAMDADGDFAVVWVGGGIPGSGSDVFGQRFNGLGEAQGSEFRVNNTTLASQVGGGVSMDSVGNFLVVWQSVHQDGFSEGIFGRQYHADGNTAVDEFLVNTVVEGPQSAPWVNMNDSGQTLVTWRGKNADHQSAVFGQRYQVPFAPPAPFKVGDEFQLGTLVELEGSGASAAMDLAGNSVVVWEAYEQDGDGLGVYGQLLDTFGDPIGLSFLVNSEFTASHQGAPAVARSLDGRFVVVWHSNAHDGDGYGIFAQLYDPTGTAVGHEFLVNTTTVGDQTSPAVAMGDDGRFVIAWQGAAGDGTTNIYARRFDATGTPIDLEFPVNNFTALDQVTPAVAMNAAGQFVIAWVSSHPAATMSEIDAEKSIFVQWYDATGLATGDEVITHNYVKDAQEAPSIGIDAAGNFVVAWQSINQDGSTWGVYARQFLADKTPVQADEFLVNETTDQLQRLVGVGIEADGNFVIAWESTSLAVDDGSSTDIYRREYFADGTPDGHENLVNTWTGGPQISPVVARTPTGNYGIFWMGQGFSHIDGVHGRLYDVNLSDDPGTPSRIPVGDQFMAGATLGFENSSPAVAINTDGTFTIAFETFEEDTSGFGIFTQRFNADGTPVDGSRVQVNSTALDDQSAPAIATDGLGNVLIVWQSRDTDGFGIFGQWYDPTGTKNGDEFLVNTGVIGDQAKPDVAMDATGRAVVTWQSAGQDGDGLGVYYVRLDAIGSTSGAEGRASESTAGDQQAPSVAVAAVDGQFVIVWQSPGPLVDGEASVEIFGRRFSGLDGIPGSEFQVNSVAQKDQILPDVAMDDSGDAVIVWQAEGQASSGSDVFGRRMDGMGVLLDTDFIINTTKPRPQRSPAVSMNADGNFLVAWQSQHQDGYSWGIYGQQYDASGMVILGEVAINERVAGPQTSPGVTVNASGQALVAWLGNDANHRPTVSGHRYLIPNPEPGFSVGTEIGLTNYQGIEEMPPAAAMNANREAVVAWVSYAEDGSGLGVFAQMLDRNGLPLGGRISVNTVTAGNQGFPAVARSASGEFIIAWDSEGVDGDGYGVYAQRYAADGTPLDSNFRVNSTIVRDQTRPAVAMAADGSFIIVWQSMSSDGFLDILAQRYSAGGATIGDELLVNTFTGLDQKDPAIAMNAAGQFVIAWVSDHPALTDPTDTEKSIFVQSYDANGQSTGPEVLVHRYVKDGQEAPAVGIDQAGRFVVAYQSINQDGNSWGVFARRFESDKTPIERSEFVVNESRQGPQRYVGLGMDEFGRFVITWQTNAQAELAGGGGAGSGGGEGSSWDVYSRQYAFDGGREGGELVVNQWLMGPQILPVVAQAPGGDFGIFWLGQGPNHTEGVHGRLYESLFDFGDAPDPLAAQAGQYPTLLASNGARHLPGSRLFLGSAKDVELDGQPSAGADGDDTDLAGDDEDGVVLPATLAPLSNVQFTVNASAAGKLDAWIDFNRNGVFEGTEQIATSAEVSAGANTLSFSVPDAVSEGKTYARFRLSTAGGLGPAGAAADGEVEDYSVQLKGLTIVAPPATTMNMRPTIAWSTVPGAVKYELWVANITTGINPVLRTVIADTSYTPTSDLGLGRFQIWVRAGFADQSFTAWTLPHTFEIKTPVVIIPMAPYQQSGFPVIQWTALAGAVRYDLWIDNLTTGVSQVIREQNLTDTQFVPAAEMPLGQYRIWVQGIDARGVRATWSAPVIISIVTPPVLTGPELSTFDATPQISWTSVAGATRYDLWIDNLTTGVSQFIREQNLTTTSFVPATDLTAGFYHVRVRAIGATGFSGYDSSIRDLVIGGQPTLLSPIGSTADTTPTVTWTPVGGALSYDLWINRIDVFQSQIVRMENLTDPQFTTSELVPGTYQAWVRSMIGSVAVSSWSASLTFVVGVSTVTAPVLTGPELSTFDTTPEIIWTPVPGATEYLVWIDNLSTGVSPFILESHVVATSYTPAALPVGDYQIWVRAFTAGQFLGVYSAPRDLNIGGRPTILSPAGISSSLPVIAWTRVGQAVRYDLWVNRIDIFQDQVIREANLVTETFIPTVPLATGTYRIWVRAVSDTAITSAWSPSVTIMVVNTESNDGSDVPVLTAVDLQTLLNHDLSATVRSVRNEKFPASSPVPPRNSDVRPGPQREVSMSLDSGAVPKTVSEPVSLVEEGIQGNVLSGQFLTEVGDFQDVDAVMSLWARRALEVL